MISREYKCIFIHIPKTAGQSIEQFFLKLHGLTWERRDALLLRPNAEPSHGPERLAHLTAQEYVDFGYVEREEFNAAFKFSFVRNPWSRLFSEYRFRGVERNISFRDFVLRGLPEQSSYSDSYRHILPQYDFLHAENGERLVDFVGRFENLQQDFQTICERLEIAATELPHANKSGSRWGQRMRAFLGRNSARSPARRGYADAYDRDTRTRVAEIYARDIEVFGYDFGEGS